MIRRIYLILDLALELQLALQPMAALLGVPQGLRHGPQLSGDSSLLLHQLLQLQGDKSSRLLSPTLQMFSGSSASIFPQNLHCEP